MWIPAEVSNSLMRNYTDRRMVPHQCPMQLSSYRLWHQWSFRDWTKEVQHWLVFHFICNNRHSRWSTPPPFDRGQSSSPRIDHVTPLPCELHWSKVLERIYELAVWHRLSSSTTCIVQRTPKHDVCFDFIAECPSNSSSHFQQRSFPAAVHCWNSLPRRVTAPPSIPVLTFRLMAYHFALSFR
jgi:hypothetical protein